MTWGMIHLIRVKLSFGGIIHCFWSWFWELVHSWRIISFLLDPLLHWRTMHSHWRAHRGFALHVWWRLFNLKYFILDFWRWFWGATPFEGFCSWFLRMFSPWKPMHTPWRKPRRVYLHTMRRWLSIYILSGPLKANIAPWTLILLSLMETFLSRGFLTWIIVV